MGVTPNGFAVAKAPARCSGDGGLRLKHAEYEFAIIGSACGRAASKPWCLEYYQPWVDVAWYFATINRPLSHDQVPSSDTVWGMVICMRYGRMS